MADSLPVHWSSSEDMRAIPTESVQAVVTSPPYHDLKDYGHENEIGSSDGSYEEYRSRLQSVWAECYDCLQADGSMWVVVDTTMHEGDLQLLPFHVAEDAQSEGFKLRDVIVWYKPTSMGGLNPNMVVNKKEYVVYLSKGNSPKVRTEIPSDNGLEDPAITENGDLGNLWRFPVKRGSLGNNILHKAPFPVGLAKRMIRISTDPWDKVLDPFLGSGTTACAARALSRQWVGYEINRDFERVIRDRLDQVEPAERNTSA